MGIKATGWIRNVKMKMSLITKLKQSKNWVTE